MAENDSDILGKLNTNDENIMNDIHQSTEYLKQVNDSVIRMMDMLSHMSQSSAKGFAEDRNREERERRQQAQRDNSTSNTSYKNTRYSSSRNNRRSSGGGVLDDFLDSFEEEFVKDIAGKDFEGKIYKSLSEFADDIGVSLENIPNDFGKELANVLSSKLQESARGQKLTQSFNDLFNDIYKNFESGFEKGVNKYRNWAGTNSYSRDVGEDINNGQQSDNSNSNSSWSWEDFRRESERPQRGERQENSRREEASRRESSEELFSNAVSQFDSAVQQFIFGLEGTSETEEAAARTMESAASVQMDAAEAENTGGASGVGGLSDLASSGAAKAGMDLTSGEALSGLASGIMGVGSSMMSIAPAVLGIGALFGAASLAMSAFSPAVDELKSDFENLQDTINRSNSSLDKTRENFETRFAADIETMVRYPFEILEDAAQEVYDTWDSLLREINGTQGYTKADLQDLIAAYSQRLQAEGLGAVVSTTDVTENLAKVLEAGLSGTAAEEFAYLATVLNAAIPTEDFFNYADEWAQLATIAMQNGYSESEAIAYANDQIESFASSILYANRELSGGFTTGLSNASDLLSSSISIAQAAGSSNYSLIASVMAATSSYVGSVAPALESSITDLIVELATGGNSSQLTALRSLAGTGASNTAFLNAFVSDPQSVLYTLFSNLSNMQNMSSSAYMEVAESLSDLFGISMDALSQIDFQYLANAIEAMDVNSTSLAENLDMLASGETTTSAEEQRMAQINEYMSTEGLSYVLDNEAARAVQQHLWDEEIANELMEATYAVDFKGVALSLTTAIEKLLNNLANVFIVGAVSEYTETKEEQEQYGELINSVVEAGRVASDATDALNSEFDKINYANMTNHTYSIEGYESGVNDILTVMGNTTKQLSTSSGSELASALYRNTSLGVSYADRSSYASLQNGETNIDEISSNYNYGIVSKNAAEEMNMLSGGYNQGNTVGAVNPVVSSAVSATEEIASSTQSMITTLEAAIPELTQSGQSYEDLEAMAAEMGIADLQAALEDLGYDRDYLNQYWNEEASNASSLEYQRRNEKEEAFWDSTLEWFDATTSWREEESEYWRNLFGGDDDYWATWFEETNKYWKDWMDTFNSDWNNIYEIESPYWQGWWTDYLTYWQEWATADQLDRQTWRSDTNSEWEQTWSDTNQTWTDWWNDTNDTWNTWWTETNDTWTNWWNETNDTWTEWWTDTFYTQMNTLWTETNELLTNIYEDALGPSTEEDSVRNKTNLIYDDALGPYSEEDSLRNKTNLIYDDALGEASSADSVRSKINLIYDDALGEYASDNSVRKNIEAIYKDALGEGIGADKSVRQNLENIYTDALGTSQESDSVRNSINDYLDKWTDYYWDEYNHYYGSFGESSSSLLSSVYSVQQSADKEETDAIYELADVLVQNVKNFEDPQVQTNVLLAQILDVVAVIMEQNNQVEGTYSLSDQLTGLASGLMNGTTATTAQV